MLMDLVGKLVMVILLMVGCAAGWKRFRDKLPSGLLPAGLASSPGSAGVTPSVQIQSTLGLGPQKQLHIVQVGDKRFLIGSTAQQISVLADLTMGERAASCMGSGHILLPSPRLPNPLDPPSPTASLGEGGSHRESFHNGSPSPQWRRGQGLRSDGAMPVKETRGEAMHDAPSFQLLLERLQRIESALPATEEPEPLASCAADDPAAFYHLFAANKAAAPKPVADRAAVAVVKRAAPEAQSPLFQTVSRETPVA